MKKLFNSCKHGLQKGLFGVGTLLGIVIIALGIYSALIGSVSGVYASQLAGTVVFLLAAGGIAAYVFTRPTATVDFDLIGELQDFLEIPPEQRALDAYKDYAKLVGRFRSKHINPALKTRSFTRKTLTPRTADMPLKTVKRWRFIGDAATLKNWTSANFVLVDVPSCDADIATHINLSSEISEQVFLTSENRVFYTDASEPAPYTVELTYSAELKADLIAVAIARNAWLHQQRQVHSLQEIALNPNKMVTTV